MSQTTVLSKFIPYLRSKLNDLGYVEHDGEYNDESIANTVIDKTYMILPRSVSVSALGHTSIQWQFPVDVLLWFSGYNKSSDAVDSSIDSVELVLDSILDISERFSLPGVSEMRPTGIDFDPIDGSNYTIIKATIGLSATINMFNDKNC